MEFQELTCIDNLSGKIFQENCKNKKALYVGCGVGWLNDQRRTTLWGFGDSLLYKPRQKLSIDQGSERTFGRLLPVTVKPFFCEFLVAHGSV